MTRRKDGRWYERVTINGKTKHLYGKTKAEVFRKIRELEETIADGTKFRSVAEEWWEEHSQKISYTTHRSYKPALTRAIEEFGDMQMQTITPMDINRFVYEVAKQFADKTVRSQRLVLNLICSYAVIHGYADTNPVREVKVPDGLKKKRRTSPPSEDIAIVKRSADKEFGLFAVMALYTGMRRGELLALEWKDIDIKSRTISVTKSLYHIENKPQIKEPKTETSIGTLPILDALLPYLKPKKGLVFPNAAGGYMTDAEYLQKWRAYAKQTGIKSTPHQFRHAYATMLYEAGIPPQDAQHLLRHAQIQTTIDVYTDLRESRMKEIHKKVYAVDID